MKHYQCLTLLATVGGGYRLDIHVAMNASVNSTSGLPWWVLRQVTCRNIGYETKILVLRYQGRKCWPAARREWSWRLFYSHTHCV